MIYYGYWFAPEREVLQKAIDAAQANVTGRVRLSSTRATSSSPGASPILRSMIPMSRPSKRTRFIDQADAEGFIRLNALAAAAAEVCKQPKQRSSIETEVKGKRPQNSGADGLRAGTARFGGSLHRLHRR